jgi:photosystem II stability/assembly factor-like uncharacterized protein
MKNYTALLLIVITISLLFNRLCAQNFWEPINGPNISKIMSLVVNSSGNLFVGTFDNGIYRSTDNAESWEKVNSLDIIAYTLAVNSKDHIFCGTDQGIFRSVSNGEFWENSGLDSLDVLTIAINEQDEIFAGTHSNGIFRSTDNGNTWIQANNGLKEFHIECLAINSESDIFAGSYLGAVFYSSDNGLNWTDVKISVSSAIVYSLYVNSDDEIFAGTFRDGIYRSSDKGNTWTYSGLSTLSVYTITMNSNGDIFAGTVDEILKSTDDCENWINICKTYARVFALKIDTSDVLFAGTFGNGIYRSTDKGESWRKKTSGLENSDVNSIDMNSRGHLFVGTSDGLFYTTNDGNNWLDPSNGLLQNNCYVAINSEDVIFAGGGAGLYRSTDNGNSWTDISLNNIRFWEIAISPSNAIFATNNNNDNTIIYRSTDNGNNWLTSQNFNIYRVNSFLFHPKENIYIGTSDGVYVSYYGEFWERIALKGEYITSLAINSDDDIFASSYYIYRRGKNEPSFTKVGEFVFDANYLVINSCNHIYAGTRWGVFRSTDNGETWTEINSGLTNLSVKTMDIDSNGYIYAGTGAGIFRSVEPTVTVEQIESEIPTSFTLSRNYPNPFNRSTTIEFSIPYPAFVNIKIYNVMGLEIAALVSEYLTAGKYSKIWYPGTLPGGTYFYRIQTDKFIETQNMIYLE